MEICKAPTLRLKALNNHTHIMYIETENVIQKKKKKKKRTMLNAKMLNISVRRQQTVMKQQQRQTWDLGDTIYCVAGCAGQRVVAAVAERGPRRGGLGHVQLQPLHRPLHLAPGGRRSPGNHVSGVGNWVFLFFNSRVGWGTVCFCFSTVEWGGELDVFNQVSAVGNRVSSTW